MFVAQEFTQLTDATRAAVAALRPDSLTAADADAVLSACTVLKRLAAGAEMLVAARAVDGGPVRAAAERLARRGGTSLGEAESLITASKALTDLPVVADALREGLLSPAQARLVIDAATAAPTEQTGLIAAAGSEDLKGLRDCCARTKAAADPDPDGRRRRIHAHRSLRCWTDPDGTRRGTWAMTPEASAEVEAALSAHTDRIFRAAHRRGDRDPLDAYRADALVAMARTTTRPRGTTPTPPATTDERATDEETAQGNTDEDGTTTAPPPSGVAANQSVDALDDLPAPIARELVIVVDLATLTDTHPHLAPPGSPPRDGRICELRGVGPVAPEVAREWLSNAFLKAILTDGTDVKLVEHLGRRAPAHLKTAIDFLHPVCADPGCNRCHRLEYDHVIPDALDGPISLTNYQPVCAPSHRAKTKTDLDNIRAARAAGRPPRTATRRRSSKRRTPEGAPGP